MEENLSKAGEPLSHDPDGYLAYLRSEVLANDSTIVTYIRESLQAYLRGLMLSSTVMLGGAWRRLSSW